MRDLERLLLMPGHNVRLDAFEGGLATLTTDAGTTSLDGEVAAKVYVSA
jgi:hypothetical protein